MPNLTDEQIRTALAAVSAREGAPDLMYLLDDGAPTTRERSMLRLVAELHLEGERLRAVVRDTCDKADASAKCLDCHDDLAQLMITRLRAAMEE